MHSTLTIDWKFVLALGAVAVGIVFAVKMDASAAERVSMCAIDAFRDAEIAIHSNSDA